MNEQQQSYNNLDRQTKDVAVVERRGAFGQHMVVPLEIQGNESNHPLGFATEWARFFSLPSGRMESIYNLGCWAFTGAALGLLLPALPWLLVVPLLILALMGVICYYTPELTVVILGRILLVTLFIIATMVVL